MAPAFVGASALAITRLSPGSSPPMIAVPAAFPSRGGNLSESEFLWPEVLHASGTNDS